MNLFATLSLLSALGGNGFQAHYDSNVVVPASSLEQPSMIGKFAHTNHLIYVGPDQSPSRQAPLLAGILSPGIPFKAFAGPSGFHPSDIRTAYGDSATGAKAIAIVDAYNYPTALSDFNTFAGQFSLPKETSTSVTASTNKVFQIVYGGNKKPTNNGGWAEEEALDIEWAHSMAPGAKIYLVEASSASYSALFSAVAKAASLPNVTQISMSWGGGEFSGESSYDANFSSSAISYFCSSGDTGGAQNYPAASPKVIGVGGTSLSITSGTSETGWNGSGGGPSAYESIPTFQGVISSIVGTHRGIPDIAAVADPYTGVAVYDSYSYQGYSGWLVFGGTSVACPVCAGIANAGGAARGSGEAAHIYVNTTGFRDVTSGTAGSFSCKAGWDYVTGWGSPISTSSF